MSEAPLAFGGLVTEHAFVRAQRLNGARGQIFGDVVTFLLFVGMIFYTTRSLVVASLSAIPATLIVSALNRSWRRRQWIRGYRASPYLHHRFDGAVLGDRLQSRSSTGASEVPWSNFVKRRVGTDVILLYHGPNLFLALFREHFASDADWAAAKQIVLGNVHVA